MMQEDDVHIASPDAPQAGSAAPPSPIVITGHEQELGEGRPRTPESAVVLEISGSVGPSYTVGDDDDGEDAPRAASTSEPNAPATGDRRPHSGSGSRTPTHEVSTPTRSSSAMRILGINYFPPVAEAEERERDTNADPLRLEIAMQEPESPWTAREHDEETAESERVGEWKGQTRDVSFSRHRRISLSRRTKPPVSSYPFGPPPSDSAFGTEPIGQLGVHHPRELVRVERDYSGGDIPQFSPAYPLELEGRITPTQFLETINAFNEILISAYSLRHGFIDNVLDIFTLHLSKLLLSTHYDKEMKRLKRTMDEFNTQLWNPAGLNILWPRRSGFLFLEIEYY